jgi:hypothetical protein
LLRLCRIVRRIFISRYIHLSVRVRVDRNTGIGPAAITVAIIVAIATVAVYVRRVADEICHK